MRLFNSFLLFAALATAVSCRTQRVPIENYLQQVDSSGAVRLVNMPEPLIQKNDLLSIRVYSMSADPRTDLPYNLPEPAGPPSGGTSPSGFLVDANGTIEYPRLGTLKVEGLTKDQLAQVIKERLDTVLRSPSVIVRFLNYKVTVLGEVRTPGSFNVPTERVTILEALGLAGDITEYGNKNTVKIARAKDGQLELGYVDLTSKALFNSPYFHLQQNDVVFVEQTRRKVQQEERQNTVQRIGIATSIVTTIALLINILR